MTVQTPMTMPTIVRKARSLCARSAISAKRRFSATMRRTESRTRAIMRTSLDSAGLRSASGATALIAGKTPAMSPVSVARTRPDTTRPGVTSVGSGENASTQSAMTQPKKTPTDAAAEREEARLEEELEEDVALARPDGEAQPDLLRPLDHGDEHDVRDHDRADDERDPADEDEERERARP